MAHFAELNSNNIVKRVIVVSDQDTTDETGVEKEEIGINFLKQLFGQNTIWKKTSYNNNIRKRYAGIGMIYDENFDAFLFPQPFSSWILNEESLDWEAPIIKPELSEEEIDNFQQYYWDEDEYQKNGIGWFITEPLNEPSEIEV